jgi:hypothetical protein
MQIVSESSPLTGRDDEAGIIFGLLNAVEDFRLRED